MKREFLDLGKQPIANKFLSDSKQFDGEFFFNLNIIFDDETKLVSISEFVPPEMMFNENYAYHSSNSYPMKEHFRKTAEMLLSEYNPVNVLEIGSNDGIFIKHFNSDTTIAVEPCGNFAEMTNDMGYKTYDDFWTTETARFIKQKYGTMDLIYAANCICHIHDLEDTFQAARELLSEDGIFVFEDPSLLRVMERGSYDQFYDEHPHMFSVTSLKKLLQKNGLSLFKVDNLSVHGGSNRIYAKLSTGSHSLHRSVDINLWKEDDFGLNNFETYQMFADRVKKSKNDLVNTLKRLKSEGKKIISYGATAKSVTVFNYCGIGGDLIDYTVDTTIDKQGKYSPGMHIPVVSPEEGFDESVDVAYLGAWNFKDAIMNKETEFIQRGGKFVTHVPEVMVFS